MLMSPARFVLLRLFNLTLGRSALMNRLLHWILVEFLVRRQSTGRKYTASSRFFSIDDLK